MIDRETNSTPAEKRSRARLTGWIWAAKAAVSTGLFLWIIARADLADTLRALSQAEPRWLLPAACSPAIGTVLTATRWGGLLRAQGVCLRLATLVQSCCVAAFFRQFLPSTIGGDAIRGYDSWRAGASKPVAVAALVVDRLLGLLILVLFAAVGICLPHSPLRQYPLVFWAVGLAAGGLLLGTWLLFRPAGKFSAAARRATAGLPRFLRRTSVGILDAAGAFGGKQRQLPRALGYSILLQTNVILFYYLLGRAMGFGISYSQFCVIVPIATLVMLVPVSINAIGVREGIFVFLLGTFGVSSAEAVAFAWLEHGVFLLYGLFGAVVFACRKVPRRIPAAPSVDAPWAGAARRSHSLKMEKPEGVGPAEVPLEAW